MRPFFKLFIIISSVLICGCVTSTSSPNLKNTGVKSSVRREINASDVHYEPSSGEIRYTLPEAATVRLRIGLNGGGALLRTLIDWEEQEAGEHTLVWDSKDDTGLVDFKNYNNVMIVIACIAKDQSKPVTTDSGIRGYRKSPKVTITFPASSETNANRVPVISGIVPVRITIAPEDHQWLLSSRFELVSFIDFAFLIEDEEGNNPYTFQFNTNGLNEGDHILTVNIAGFDGEIGTRSVRVFVKK